MKELIKTPEIKLNKMGISNLSDAEFKTLVIKMLKELSEDLNSIQLEMKDTLSEIKNNLQETTVEHIYGSCVLTHSRTLCHLIGTFKSFTFKVIIERYVFIVFLF